MAYDEAAAARARRVLAETPGIAERRMMGGLVFLLHGHMACGITGAALMVRVGADARAEALTLPHVRPLDIGRGSATGFVCVDPHGFATDERLRHWIARGLEFAARLPPK